MSCVKSFFCQKPLLSKKFRNFETQRLQNRLLTKEVFDKRSFSAQYTCKSYIWLSFSKAIVELDMKMDEEAETLRGQ